MLRLKITREEGLYYWTITRNGVPVCAGVRGFVTEGEADVEARVKWREYTGQCPGLKTGDKIRYRGTFATSFSVRGLVEVIRPMPKSGAGIEIDGEWVPDPVPQNPFGIRFENGNFAWANEDQLMKGWDE